jgi:hypothetical protein
MEEPVLSLDSIPPHQANMQSSPDDDAAEVEGVGTEASLSESSADDEAAGQPEKAKKPSRPRAPRKPKKPKE